MAPALPTKPNSLEHRTTSPLPLTLLQSIHTHTHLDQSAPTATISVSELQFVRLCVSNHSCGLVAPFCNSLSSSETTGAWKLIAQRIEGTLRRWRASPQTRSLAWASELCCWLRRWRPPRWTPSLLGVSAG